MIKAATLTPNNALPIRAAANKRSMAAGVTELASKKLMLLRTRGAHS
jgi:hypothetical protein